LLYELLTGTTPLDRKSLQKTSLFEVLRQIREEDPPKPSLRLEKTVDLPEIAANRGLEPNQLRSMVRGELDWIVLKCLERDRNRRYETALSLAHDVERYLADKPVQASPPSTVYRLRKFARRHKPVLIGSIVISAAVLAAVGILGWTMRDGSVRQATLDQGIAQALDEAEIAYRHGQLPKARAAVQRVEGLLAGGEGSAPIQRRVRQWQANLLMVSRLEELLLETVTVKDGHFDLARPVPAYREEFRRYGVDVDALDPQEAAERIRSSVICDRLVCALDDWAVRTVERLPGQERLLAIAQQADDDPWRKRLRDAFARKDKVALQDLARKSEAVSQPPATICFLARTLNHAVARSDDRAQLLQRQEFGRLAINVLRQAQKRYPGDFWINQNLALVLMESKSPATSEALGFYRAAVALRSDSPGVHVNMGRVFDNLGQRREAEAEYRAAIRLKPDYEPAHCNLASLLRRQERLPEAEAAYREALRLNADFAPAHFGLGNLFLAKSKWAEAEAAFRKAAALYKNQDGSAGAHFGIGEVFRRQNKPSKAEPEYREVIRLQPDFAEAHYCLGRVLLDQTKLAQAMAEFRQLLKDKPNYLQAHYGLCDAYARSGDWNNAAAECARLVELAPANHWNWYEHAVLRLQIGDADGYRRACREMLDRFSETDQAEIAERVAKTCLLMPDSVNDPERVHKLVRRAENGKHSPYPHYFHRLDALADFRAGRYAEAGAVLNSLAAEAGSFGHDAATFALLAMVQHHLGKADEARAALAKSGALLDRGRPFQSSWWDWLHAQVHYREAEVLVNGKGP
jgi:serine/threonine-protein kinase